MGMDSAPIKFFRNLRENLSIVSARAGQYYADHLGENWKEFFQDKKVLNLGSGTDDLQRGVAEVGVETTVIPFDLKFVKRWYKEKPQDMVKGDMAKLPFPDDSFDSVIASESMSRWLPIRKQGLALTEAIRVAKPGGEIVVFEWRTGLDKIFNPNDVAKAVATARETYPDIQVGFNEQTKTLKIIK